LTPNLRPKQRENAHAVYGRKRRKIYNLDGTPRKSDVLPLGDDTWICQDCGLNFDDGGNKVTDLTSFDEPSWRRFGRTTKRRSHD